MLTKTLLHTFLDYNYQANAKILAAFAALTPKQMQQETAISHGNALELLRHMADTEWSWRLYTGEGTGGKYLWDVEDISDLTKLAAFWVRERERMLTYLDALSEDALAEVAELSPTFRVPRWQIFLHLVNHSTHHRSELSQYLTQCGSTVTEGEIEFIRFGVETAEK
ncbi:MAG: DinB family protein [Caldilineaceae bacterium]|nr:DinB family protein [Caldilineaceae bacterium]